MRPFPPELRLSPRVQAGWEWHQLSGMRISTDVPSISEQSQACTRCTKCDQLPQGEEDKEGRQLATCHSHSPGRKEEGRRLCPRKQLWLEPRPAVDTGHPGAPELPPGTRGRSRTRDPWDPLWDPAQHHTNPSL